MTGDVGYVTGEGERVEQRRSCRYPARGSHQEAVLKVGRTSVAAVPLDESAGGFAVFVGRDLNILAGDRAQLKIDGYWYEVRVKYMEEERPPSQAGDADAGVSPPALAFRIGLERIRDLGPLDDPVDHLRLRGPLHVRLAGSPFLWLVVATSFVTSVVVAAAISLLVTYCTSGPGPHGP